MAPNPQRGPGGAPRPPGRHPGGGQRPPGGGRPPGGPRDGGPREGGGGREGGGPRPELPALPRPNQPRYFADGPDGAIRRELLEGRADALARSCAAVSAAQLQAFLEEVRAIFPPVTPRPLSVDGQNLRAAFTTAICEGGAFGIPADRALQRQAAE